MTQEQDEKPILPREQSLTEDGLQKPKILPTTAVEIKGIQSQEVLNYLLKELQHETDDGKRKQKLELINGVKDMMYDVRLKEIEIEKATAEMEQGVKNIKRNGVLHVINEIGVIVGILSLFIILGISAFYTFKFGSNVGLFLMCLILSVIAYGTYVSEFNFSFMDLFKFEGKAKKSNEKKNP